jgi:hypothetical protein
VKTLSSADDLTDIRSRIALLSPTDVALWGSMSTPGMVCHLSDAFKYPLGERDVAAFKSLPIPRFLFKWLALHFPVRWPKGIKAPPEIAPRMGGTPSGDFETDRALLLSKLEAFTRISGPLPPHPIFGPLTHAEWMRWGYLHCDHHLRQFGL